MDQLDKQNESVTRAVSWVKIATKSAMSVIGHAKVW